MGYLISTNWPMSKLMELFESGQIAVPEIQRDVVWKPDQVKDLVHSIFSDFPCGSLIMWEPRQKDEQLMKEIIRPERLAFYKNQPPRYFLIDGQQRITTLASVMLEPGFLKKVEPSIEEDLPSLYVNLRRFPEDIEATSDSDASNFPSSVLMNDLFLGRFRDRPEYTTKLTASQRTEIDKNIQRFRDYQFPVQIIQGQGYATVGKIFALVNSQGTQLTGAEIHMATIIPYWKGLSRELRDYRKELRDHGYDLDLTFLMRSITVVECNVPQIKKLADKIKKEVEDKTLSKVKLNRLWSETRTAVDVVIKSLRKNLLLDRTQFVVSKNALVPLVYYAAKSGKKRLDQKAMMKFFLVSQLGERYGGAQETVLRRDLSYMPGSNTSVKQGFGKLLDIAVSDTKQYYRALKVRADDIYGVSSKNVFVLFMYLVTRKRNASDFGLNDTLQLNHIQEPLQLHHIFPYDFMTKDDKALRYRKEHDLSLPDYRAEVNDIANLTFLSQGKNASIGSQSPWQYLENETTSEMRWAHFIPEDKNLWRPENYNKFLEQRRFDLSIAINSLMRSLH